MGGTDRSGGQPRAGRDEGRDATAAGAARRGQEERDARHARALAQLDLGLAELRRALRGASTGSRSVRRDRAADGRE